MDNFLNSNLLISIITFLVGGFAICLYIKQKVDHEKDAAKLILQEIRYAEQQIRNFRVIGSYSLADKLLPTNSWHKNIHLFVGKLKETEIDMISRFYSNSAYLDIVISKISDKKNDILTQINPSPSSPTIPLLPINTFELNSNKILIEVSQKIEFIYNTPAVGKLRELAEKRRFFIL
jgi:hypothetical protein